MREPSADVLLPPKSRDAGAADTIAPLEAERPLIAERDAAAWKRSSLFVDSITVSFDGFRALENLSLLLEPGELRCIIGPNGAGKTTLLDVITGKTKPDGGKVYVHGQEVELTGKREHEIVRHGVGRKFQRPTVFTELSVFENLELSLKTKKGVFSSLFGRLSARGRERIDEILETIVLSEHRARRAGLLSHGQKQWLEIGMLLALDPQILLVDEPVAGMTHQESERTAGLLSRLSGERTVVVVEHDMDFVRSIARTVTVLHEGRVLAEGPMDKVQADPNVVEVYLGS